jgi:hypothetical protein
MTSTISRTAAVAPRPRLLVLLDPRGAFTAVALRPLWGLGVIFMLAFALLPPLVFVARTDAEAIVKRELQASGRMEQLTAEQREQAIALGSKGTKILLPIGAAAKRSIWMTILTLVCLAVLKGSRPDLKMSPVAGAVAVAMAPLAVHDVCVAATFLFKDPMQLDATNAVLSNPAAWLGYDAGHSVAGALLRGLDFFELWSAWLVGLGVNVVANSRSSLPYVVAFGGHALATIMGAIGPALR